MAQRQFTEIRLHQAHLQIYVGPYRQNVLVAGTVMTAVKEIYLEIVAGDVLRLRVGQETIAFTALEDRALVKLSEVARRYARRRKMRFVDVTRN